MLIMSKQFKKEIEEGLSEMCNAIGFKKKKNHYCKLIKDNVYATLGIGMSQRIRGHVLVDVTIGVRYEDVEELRNKLTDCKSSKYIQPTIGTQLGYLMPDNDYREWVCIEGADNAPQLNDLSNSIVAYGYKYIDRMANFDNLFEAFAKREPGILIHARDEYLPMLYYLKNEKEKGLKFIEEAIERRSQPMDKEEKASLQKQVGPEGRILMAGEDNGSIDWKQLEKLERIIIVGSGYNGVIDPLYLKFVENYKAL